MTARDWRGSFAIPMTPFDENDHINQDVLAAEVNFCIESGVGGLVVPVMVSEFRVLSEEERRTMIRVPVQVSSGRVPVVANCAAVNTPLRSAMLIMLKKWELMRLLPHHRRRQLPHRSYWPVLLPAPFLQAYIHTRHKHQDSTRYLQKLGHLL